MEAQLNKVLGLQRTSSRDSFISFGSINTKEAYKRFCKGLFGIGVTAEMIMQKEEEIHNIFKPSNTTTGSQIDDDTIVVRVRVTYKNDVVILVILVQKLHPYPPIKFLYRQRISQIETGLGLAGFGHHQ